VQSGADPEPDTDDLVARFGVGVGEHVVASDDADLRVPEYALGYHWIDNQHGVAKVQSRYGVDPVVRTMHPVGRAAYVQTQPNDTTTDNLLSLPPC